MIAVFRSYIKRDRLHNELVEHICLELEKYFADASYSELIQYIDQVIDDVIIANATRLGGSYEGSLMNRLHFMIDTLSSLEVQSRQQIAFVDSTIATARQVLMPAPPAPVPLELRPIDTSLLDQFQILK